MMIPMEFFIAAAQDITLARRIVEECMTSNRYIYLGMPWIVTVSQVSNGSGAAVRLCAKGYVLDVKYEQEYASTLTERVLKAFREKSVAVPGEPPEPAAPEPPARAQGERLAAA
jgi:hypothetical protein